MQFSLTFNQEREYELYHPGKRDPQDGEYNYPTTTSDRRREGVKNYITPLLAAKGKNATAQQKALQESYERWWKKEKDAYGKTSIEKPLFDSYTRRYVCARVDGEGKIKYESKARTAESVYNNKFILPYRDPDEGDPEFTRYIRILKDRATNRKKGFYRYGHKFPKSM